MYVCMHVCMYVCMYGGFRHHNCPKVMQCMYVCMHVCMYVCMYAGFRHHSSITVMPCMHVCVAYHNKHTYIHRADTWLIEVAEAVVEVCMFMSECLHVVGCIHIMTIVRTYIYTQSG
jgi:hypothetical protein